MKVNIKITTAASRLKLLEQFNELVLQETSYENVYKAIAIKNNRSHLSIARDIQHAKKHYKEYIKIVNHPSQIKAPGNHPGSQPTRG